MDGNIFDRLTKRAARSSSRRDLVRAGLAAVIGSLVVGRRVSARQTCNEPFIFCDGKCVYAPTSRDHCGDCGNACDQTVCVEGVCTVCEDIGQTTCYDPIGDHFYCADLATSYIDCGACGNMCTTGPCDNGTCVSTQDCDPGFTECNGKCVDLQTDTFFCGSCLNACTGIPGPGQSSVGVCVDGGCQIVCEDGYTLCDGQCLEGGCPSGEEPTEAAPPEPTTVPVEGRRAHVHRGTCDRLRKDPTWDLTDVTAPTGEREGSRRAEAAEASSTVIDVSLDELLATSHVVHVHATGPDASDDIVCGEIGGVRRSDGSIVIGLREVNSSGYEGIAMLTPDPADPSMTDVEVVIASTLSEEEQPTSTAASGAATPEAST